MIRALFATLIHVAIATGLFYGWPYAVEYLGQFPEFTQFFAQYAGMEWAETAKIAFYPCLAVYMSAIYFLSKWCYYSRKSGTPAPKAMPPLSAASVLKK